MCVFGPITGRPVRNRVGSLGPCTARYKSGRTMSRSACILPSGQPRAPFPRRCAWERLASRRARTLPCSMNSAQSAAPSQPLPNGVFALLRHLCHVLISVRDGKQVVPGPRCGKPLCDSPYFLRSFAPKGFIHVRRLCHRVPFLLRQSLFSPPHLR
jgi:hypothetical protein